MDELTEASTDTLDALRKLAKARRAYEDDLEPRLTLDTGAIV
jgi:hypothetical protein